MNDLEVFRPVPPPEFTGPGVPDPSVTPQPAGSRLTVVEQVYHGVEGDDPTSVVHRFYRMLKSDEMAHVYRTKVTSRPEPLDSARLRSVGCVRVVNEEGRYFRVNPTPVERWDVLQRVVEVFQVLPDGTLPLRPFALIPPGEDVRFTPGDFEGLRVRVQHQTAKVTVYVYPG
jgi:hypothetical protein